MLPKAIFRNAFAGAALILGSYFFSSYLQEVDKKLDYGVLQSIELSSREVQGLRTKEKVLLINYQGNKAMGVLSREGSQRIWILLTPKASKAPVAKLFDRTQDDYDYDITTEEYNEIVEFAEVNSETIFKELASHVKQKH